MKKTAWVMTFYFDLQSIHYRGGLRILDKLKLVNIQKFRKSHWHAYVGVRKTKNVKWVSIFHLPNPFDYPDFYLKSSASHIVTIIIKLKYFVGKNHINVTFQAWTELPFCHKSPLCGILTWLNICVFNYLLTISMN